MVGCWYSTTSSACQLRTERDSARCEMALVCVCTYSTIVHDVVMNSVRSQTVYYYYLSFLEEQRRNGGATSQLWRLEKGISNIFLEKNL